TISVANSLVSPCRIKAVVQAELRGMNAGKLVIEAELPARDCNSPRSGGEATRLEAVARTDEHILAFDAPVVVNRPFDTAAHGPSGDCVGCVSRGDNPVAAPRGNRLTRISYRSLYLNKCGAALDVEYGTIPSISHAAGDHPIPVADLAVTQDIRRGFRQRWTAKRIKSSSLELHVTGFAFETEHKGRADRLPVAAYGAAGGDAAARSDVPGMLVFQPPCDHAARIRTELRVA